MNSIEKTKVWNLIYGQIFLGCYGSNEKGWCTSKMPKQQQEKLPEMFFLNFGLFLERFLFSIPVAG